MVDAASRQRVPYPEHTEQNALVTTSDVAYDIGREYADHVARVQPEILTSIGLTADEFAAACNDVRSLDEAVEAGWISAAEQRFIEARAAREDFLELGYEPDAIDALLAEQQACSSSS